MGLTSYVMDFRGKPPTTNWPLLPAFSSHLGFINREHGPHFAHALNARYGLRRDRSGWVPARDMLLLTECFDSFGSAHTTPPMSREFMKKVQEGTIEPAPPKLFDPSVYGYRSEDVSMKGLRARAKSLGVEATIQGAAFSDESSRSAIVKILNATANGVSVGPSRVISAEGAQSLTSRGRTGSKQSLLGSTKWRRPIEAVTIRNLTTSSIPSSQDSGAVDSA